MWLCSSFMCCSSSYIDASAPHLCLLVCAPAPHLCAPATHLYASARHLCTFTQPLLYLVFMLFCTSSFCVCIRSSVLCACRSFMCICSSFMCMCLRTSSSLTHKHFTYLCYTPNRVQSGRDLWGTTCPYSFYFHKNFSLTFLKRQPSRDS